jgi:hypothetical protein
MSKGTHAGQANNLPVLTLIPKRKREKRQCSLALSAARVIAVAEKSAKPRHQYSRVRSPRTPKPGPPPTTGVGPAIRKRGPRRRIPSRSSLNKRVVKPSRKVSVHRPYVRRTIKRRPRTQARQTVLRLVSTLRLQIAAFRANCFDRTGRGPSTQALAPGETIVNFTGDWSSDDEDARPPTLDELKRIVRAWSEDHPYFHGGRMMSWKWLNFWRQWRPERIAALNDLPTAGGGDFRQRLLVAKGLRKDMFDTGPSDTTPIKETEEVTVVQGWSVAPCSNCGDFRCQCVGKGSVI